MDKKKTGLVIFWLGIIWAILWGLVIGLIFVSPAFRNLTMDELNQTMWTTNGLWFFLWVFGVPLGALVAGIGILLYSDAKGSTVGKFGIGVALAIIIGMGAGHSLGHFPPLFGIGGALILLSFFGILWLWAKERMALDDTFKTAADLKLVGYVFLLIATWFVCGIAAIPFLKALEGLPASSPIHIMIFMALGWIFLFLGHYKSRKQ